MHKNKLKEHYVTLTTQSLTSEIIIRSHADDEISSICLKQQIYGKNIQYEVSLFYN